MRDEKERKQINVYMAMQSESDRSKGRSGYERAVVLTNHMFSRLHICIYQG